MAKKLDLKLNEVTPVSSIRELLEIADRETPENVAFMFKSKGELFEISYHEFVETVKHLGRALYARGVKKTHIACVGENSYNWLTAYLTVLCSDSVIVPVDRELPEDDLINVIDHSESELVFCSARFESIFREHRAELPGVKYFICFDAEEDDGVFLSYKKLLEYGAEQPDDGGFAGPASDIDEMKMLVYTSGTTGRAKGVMLSEGNLVSCVYYGLQVSTIYTRGLSVLPYNHTYAAVPEILVSLHHHSTICINDKLRNVLKNLQFYKPDYIYLVPAFAELFYKKIWQNAAENGKDKALRSMIKVSRKLRKIGIDKRRKFFAAIHNTFGGNLRKIVCGGAPIRSEIGEFFDDIGIDLIGGYGITECSPLVSVNRDQCNDCTTVGLKLPCIDVDIFEPNEEGIGEIRVKGKTVMLGYYKNEEATAEVLRDGWFYTGDYGYFKPNGLLVISGRKKNLIVLSNGKNVYPEELENRIYSIPYVKEVVVSGIKDENGEEVGLSAEVYLDPETTGELTDEEKNENLRRDVTGVTADLPMYKRVTELVLRAEEFPKTTANKIKRNYNK